jgi:polyisoprenoid-binding protein YceI
VVGQLTACGRTQPASLSAQVSRFDGGEAWLDGDLRVNRADFGLTWNQMGMASMHNTITVHAVFTRQ